MVQVIPDRRDRSFEVGLPRERVGIAPDREKGGDVYEHVAAMMPVTGCFWSMTSGVCHRGQAPGKCPSVQGQPLRSIQPLGAM